MADNIVQGLFGMTPEAYQQNQNELAQAQALKFANLDPFQRSAYGMFLGGNQLGNAIGGALGAQDPMLQRISQQQQLLKNINPSDAASLAAGIKQATDMGNPQLALSLSDALQKLQKNQAEIAKSQREGMTNEQKNAATWADTAATRGTPEWTAAYKKELGRLTDKTPTAVQEAQIVADAQGIVDSTPVGSPERNKAEALLKAYKQGKMQITQVGVAGNTDLVQNAFVDPYNPNAKPIPVGAPFKRATSNVSFSPDIQLASKELDWRKQYLTENKPVIEQGSNVRQSLNLLEQSQTSPFADAAFANTVVSAFGGDKQKSKSEIDRLVKSGSLDERIANTLTGFFEGTTSAKTKADQVRVLQAVDKALEARYNASASGWKGRLEKAKVDSTLVIPDYSSVVGNAPSQANTLIEGKTYVNQKTGQRAKVVNGQLVPE